MASLRILAQRGPIPMALALLVACGTGSDEDGAKRGAGSTLATDGATEGRAGSHDGTDHVGRRGGDASTDGAAHHDARRDGDSSTTRGHSGSHATADHDGDRRTGGWRLATEDSPYLRQHADNPVEWYPWGDEAFAVAQREDKVVFLSIGYSSCHWCHVMEHESFEDQETADYLAEHFISIKVDREQRPDVDARYMQAVTRMTGRGGWPLTAFLTPDGAPFSGGTYFPLTESRGMPSFKRVLASVKDAWDNDRAGVLRAARQMTTELTFDRFPAPGDWIPAEALAEAVVNIEKALDPMDGGLRSNRPQRFPPSTLLQFLLRQHQRGTAVDLDRLQVTLDKMAGGGMYDHVGGGFHRYSVDPKWKVPHFEKMLYDNALLAPTYAEAAVVTGEARHARVARHTLRWLLDDMRSPEGLYFSARDADSLPFDANDQPLPGVHPEEGDVYCWTPAQLDAVLGEEDGEHFARLFRVSPAGNFERKLSILRPMRTHEALSRDPGEGLPTGDAFLAWLDERFDRLREARARRPQAFRDEKCLAAWNGLALTAFARCGRLLDDDAYLAEAKSLAEALVSHLRRDDGSLAHQVFEGRVSGVGDLSDHANVARGLLDTYEATGHAPFLVQAVELTNVILDRFEDSEKGGFFQSLGDELLPGKRRAIEDGARPAGQSVAIELLLRLAPLDDAGRFHGAAERALASLGQLLGRHPTSFPSLLVAADAYAGPLAEVVLDGDPGPDYERLLDEARGRLLPASLLVSSASGASAALSSLYEEEPSLLAGRRGEDGPRAWVCTHGVCLFPATSPDELREQWSSVTAR